MNTKKRTYMELKQIKNKLLEYSDIKPKKQKFIHIYNKSMNKDKIFKKFFQKSNNSLIKNLSRNNNILNINIIIILLKQIFQIHLMKTKLIITLKEILILRIIKN